MSDEIAKENADVLENELGTDVQSAPTGGLAPFNPANVPVLEDLEESQFSEVSEYWTPEKKGETKLVFFETLAEEITADTETGEEKLLKTVIMWEQKDGVLSKISNASSRLYGHFERANYAPGQPLKIVYKGKSKNKNNSYSSDTWDVFKLYPKK